MKFKNMMYVGAAFLLGACATNNRDSQTELKKNLVKKDYSKALELINDKKFLSEKNDELLKMFERGRVLYLSGNYFQALNEFNKAKDLSEQLFTVSVSKKAATVLANDNADNYYGSNFEKSMIRFYQSLTHMMLFKKGEYETYTFEEKSADGKSVVSKKVEAKKLSDQEKKFHLTAAKSVLLDWDTYLNSVKAVTGGEVTFKDDLLAKVFGGFIHENFGTAADVTVAKDLYKVGKEVMFKNYDIYPTYNQKYQDFRKDFSKFAEMPITDVEKNYVVKTEYNTELSSYLDSKIEKLSKGQKDNCLFVFEEGFISEKVVKKFDIPLAGDGASASDSKMVGDAGFLSFSVSVLGAAKDALPKIYFELPEIVMPKPAGKTVLIIEDLKGAKITELKMQLINPMGEIANQALDEMTKTLYLKTGVRVAGKHLAALIVAYQIYKSNQSKGDFIAMSLATLSYKAANKGIEFSERADLRSWKSLPQHLKLVSTSLKAGDYKLKIVTDGVEVESREFRVESGEGPTVISM